MGAAKMVIVDYDTGQDPAVLAAIAAAVQKQTERDFGLPEPDGYGKTAEISVSTDGNVRK